MASHSSKKRIALLILASRKMNLKFSPADILPNDGKLMRRTCGRYYDRDSVFVVHTHMHTSIIMHMHACTHAYVHIKLCMHIHVYIHIHVHVCTCMHTQKHTCTCMHKRTKVRSRHILCAPPHTNTLDMPTCTCKARASYAENTASTLDNLLQPGQPVGHTALPHIHVYVCTSYAHTHVCPHNMHIFTDWSTLHNFLTFF